MYELIHLGSKWKLKIVPHLVYYTWNIELTLTLTLNKGTAHTTKGSIVVFFFRECNYTLY